MNTERILDLAVKSGHIVGELPLNANEKIQLAGLEKFAELIVKETMQVVANNSSFITYLDVADAVIEHFGVEE